MKLLKNLLSKTQHKPVDRFHNLSTRFIMVVTIWQTIYLFERANSWSATSKNTWHKHLVTCMVHHLLLVISENFLANNCAWLYKLPTTKGR